MCWRITVVGDPYLRPLLMDPLNSGYALQGSRLNVEELLSLESSGQVVAVSFTLVLWLL